MMSQSAIAGPTCIFLGRDLNNGNVVADGVAYTKNKSRACKRAERRCNRELNRKRRAGKVGRARCIKLEQAVSTG
jgi:hypothetical protein